MVESIFSFSNDNFKLVRNKLHHWSHSTCQLTCFQFGQLQSIVFHYALRFGHVLSIKPLDLDLNPFPNKPWFLRVCSTSLENTVGKGEIARNEQFLLFPQCFLPFG